MFRSDFCLGPVFALFVWSYKTVSHKETLRYLGPEYQYAKHS